VSLQLHFVDVLVPRSLKTSLLTPILKRGDATDPANYRPIGRFYAIILVQRLIQYIKQQQLRFPTQTTYLPQLGTIHQAFTLHHVIDKHMHARRPLYLCFVDLKAAYDRVQWPLLWQMLERLGLQGPYNDGCLLSVRISGPSGEGQALAMGPRQRCPLSATLFSLFIDGLHSYLETHAPDAGIQIRQLCLQELV